MTTEQNFVKIKRKIQITNVTVFICGTRNVPLSGTILPIFESGTSSGSLPFQQDDERDRINYKKKNRTNSISKDIFGAPSVKRIVLRTTFQRQTRRFQNVLGVPLRQRFGRCFVRSAHVVLGAYAVRCSWLVRSFTIVHGVSSANALSVESDFRRTIGNRKTRFLSIIDHRDRRRVARTALN